MRRKKAELLGGPWHRGPSIRGFGDVIPGARSGRSGAGRPSWILASSVSRPFSIKPAGLATFHYDNKIYRIWGLEGEKEREGGTHHDAQNATGGERGWMAYLGDHGRRRPRLHGGGRDQIRDGDLHFAFTFVEADKRLYNSPTQVHKIFGLVSTGLALWLMANEQSTLAERIAMSHDPCFLQAMHAMPPVAFPKLSGHFSITCDDRLATVRSISSPSILHFTDVIFSDRLDRRCKATLVD